MLAFLLLLHVNNNVPTPSFGSSVRGSRRGFEVEFAEIAERRHSFLVKQQAEHLVAEQQHAPLIEPLTDNLPATNQTNGRMRVQCQQPKKTAPSTTFLAQHFKQTLAARGIQPWILPRHRNGYHPVPLWFYTIHLAARKQVGQLVSLRHAARS